MYENCEEENIRTKIFHHFTGGRNAGWQRILAQDLFVNLKNVLIYNLT